MVAEVRVLTHLPLTAYMRQWAGSVLVHLMVCRLSGTKPLPEPMLPYCAIRNKTFFIAANAFETVVCEMAAILCKGDELIIFIQ